MHIASILKRIHENDGVYIPSDAIPNSIHCAVDNLDFSEDTVDGRRTLHGIVITVYQIKKESDTFVPLSLASPNKCSVKSFDNANHTNLCKPTSMENLLFPSCASKHSN